MEFPEIHFGGDNPKLHSYKKHFWQPGETRLIEFYPNQLVSVTLLYSTDPSLFEKLSKLIDGKPISIDLEWAQPINHSPHPIELFQFSSSKGTIIVASHENRGYDQIAKFLHSSIFFGKGMSCDKKKLIECLGEKFDDIEDIEQTRLQPNDLPLNFESLTKIFLGPGTAKFKDHKVQRSDWSVRPLSILQILYGAHDSYAMLQVYNKIIEKYGSEIKVVLNKEKSDKEKKKSKPKQETVKSECHFIDIDEYFHHKNIDLNYNLNAETDMLSEKPPTIKEQLVSLLQKKGSKFSKNEEDSVFIEHADEIVPLLLPGQNKEKRNQALERIFLAADLLLRGIISPHHDDKFKCQICFKFLKDPMAMVQHSFSRHLKESTAKDLDPKDVLFHFLIADRKVKCPFKYVYDDSQLKNITFEEEEDEEDDDDDDSNSDGNSDKSKEIVPLEYDESEGLQCLLCNKNEKFDSVESLRNHCWLNHHEMFVKLVTGKGFDKGKEEDNKKLLQFGSFCVKQLKIGSLNDDNLSINCALCNFNIATFDKFFNHIFFKHQQFALVKNNQYLKWPIRYSEFMPQMTNITKSITKVFNYDELDRVKVFSKKDNKCVDCNVSFKNDEERDIHYLQNHLIYFPPDKEQPKH